ncbi:hypothetical protein WN944_019554 [Citrus x changshan-huyou]|uniref:Uncharacterized protein n=1 Tax=Citrus x changshan-huyou TaxID=2935761 RepID=A0AAP0LYT3_9ROSI
MDIQDINVSFALIGGSLEDKKQHKQKECCCNKLAKMRKNLATKELKQIWNSAVAVVVVVAILEQRQRKFCAG